MSVTAKCFNHPSPLVSGSWGSWHGWAVGTVGQLARLGSCKKYLFILLFVSLLIDLTSSLVY